MERMTILQVYTQQFPGWNLRQYKELREWNQALSSHLICSVVGTAHQWAGFDMLKTQRERELFEIQKFIGMVKAPHRDVSGRRLQILAYRENIGFAICDISNRLADLV
jgi:hypothetical protein